MWTQSQNTCQRWKTYPSEAFCWPCNQLLRVSSLSPRKLSWTMSLFSYLPQKFLHWLVILLSCLSLFQRSVLTVGILKFNTEDIQVTHIYHILELRGTSFLSGIGFRERCDQSVIKSKHPFRGTALRAVVEAGSRHCLLTLSLDFMLVLICLITCVWFQMS